MRYQAAQQSMGRKTLLEEVTHGSSEVQSRAGNVGSKQPSKSVVEKADRLDILRTYSRLALRSAIAPWKS
eukprot:5582256-Amphidinium_carterae.1